MSKELEALDKIINSVDGYTYYAESLDREYEIIKEKLKRLEELKKAFDSLSKEDEKTKKLLSKEIEKNKALNEILALHDKWLGNEMSDFEFFTLLSEVKDKYVLSKEVSL